MPIGNLRVELRPVGSLRASLRNPRTHDDAQLAKIVASIKEFGWTNPILLDETGESERRAKDAVRSIRAEVKKLKDAGNAAAAEFLWKWAVKSQGAARLEALLKLARTEPEIAARDEDFDRDAWLLNVQNGTLDLRTGELRGHRREDLLTRLVPVAYEAGAEAPRWLKFLEQVQPEAWGVRRLPGLVIGVDGERVVVDVTDRRTSVTRRVAKAPGAIVVDPDGQWLLQAKVERAP